MTSRACIPLIILALALHSRAGSSYRDINADGNVDTVSFESFPGKTSSEYHLSVVDGSSGEVYATVKIGHVENFFSVVPLGGATGAFYPHFRRLVVDSLCGGFLETLEPDEALLWLLDKYCTRGSGSIQHFTYRWFDQMPGFEPCFAVIGKGRYPDLVESVPSQLVRSNVTQKLADTLFAAADSLMLVHYRHNHLRGREASGKWTPASGEGELQLYTTAHGVLLKRNSRFSWIYISDNLDKLRRPSISAVALRDRTCMIEQVSVYGTRRIAVELAAASFAVEPLGDYGAAGRARPNRLTPDSGGHDARSR